MQHCAKPSRYRATLPAPSLDAPSLEQAQEDVLVQHCAKPHLVIGEVNPGLRVRVRQQGLVRDTTLSCNSEWEISKQSEPSCKGASQAPPAKGAPASCMHALVKEPAEIRT